MIKFRKECKLKIPAYIFNKSPNEHIVTIIGGFQSAMYSEQVANIKSEEKSIFPESLESWIVIQRVLVNYENMILKNVEKALNKG